MARIKIEDLPKNMKISKEEMRKIAGGFGVNVSSFNTASFNISPAADSVTAGSDQLDGAQAALQAANDALSGTDASGATRDAPVYGTGPATKPSGSNTKF